MKAQFDNVDCCNWFCRVLGHLSEINQGLYYVKKNCSFLKIRNCYSVYACDFAGYSRLKNYKAKLLTSTFWDIEYSLFWNIQIYLLETRNLDIP